MGAKESAVSRLRSARGRDLYRRRSRIFSIYAMRRRGAFRASSTATCSGGEVDQAARGYMGCLSRFR
jgi:hypothetical protein